MGSISACWAIRIGQSFNAKTMSPISRLLIISVILFILALFNGDIIINIDNGNMDLEINIAVCISSIFFGKTL